MAETIVLQLFLILHFISLSWGVGGATIGFIFNILSSKKTDLRPHISSVMPYISKLIMISLIILGISGVGIQSVLGNPTFINYWADFPLSIVKFILVIILVLIGLFLVIKLAPKLESLNPKGGPPSEEFLKTRKIMILLGTINFILWYGILILAIIMA
jgi:putative copper export protein